jgi:TonB family protein
MRILPLFILCLLTLEAAAQRGKDKFEDRRTMVNDSVTKVERWDLKKELVVSRSFYIGQRPVGMWQELDGKGRVLVERDFDTMRYGPLPETKKDTTAKDSTSIKVLDTMPEFPGGEAELFKFLGRNIKYPEAAQEEGISGVVYLVGVVGETGDWRNVTVLQGAHPLLDFEAWRVCELMPQWTPGEHDGKPVTVQYNLPIRFSLR